MAKIKLTLPGLEIPVDGKQVSFTAPCSCSAVDGIQIDGVDYDLVDSAGNVVPFGRFVWCEGAVLTVTLDVTNRKAYLQNQNAYTRYETLTSATAELFGLEPGAGPNNVFSFLGKYNQHWWARNAIAGYYSTYLTDSNISISASAAYTMTYADAVTVSQTNGTISMVNPQTISVNRGEQLYSYFAGHYFSLSGISGIYYAPVDATVTISTTLKFTRYKVESVYNEANGETEYVQASNRNAYPDSGESDGFKWQYLGVPFQNAVTAPKIATGSYTGTGKYGVNVANQCSLSFAFEPKLLVIGGIYNTSNGYMAVIYPKVCGFMFNQNLGSQAGSNAISLKTTLSGNTVTWGNEANAHNQMNISGVTYNYIAIG